MNVGIGNESSQPNRQTNPGNIKIAHRYTNVGILNESTQFHFWEYIIGFSVQCILQSTRPCLLHIAGCQSSISLDAVVVPHYKQRGDNATLLCRSKKSFYCILERDMFFVTKLSYLRQKL
jgi:hypothetical protein